MTLQQIIDTTRYRLGNYEPPYHWIDSELVAYCNDILNTFCERTLVLKDSSTTSVCELYANSSNLDYSISSYILYIFSAKCVTSEILTLDTAPSTAWAADDTITGATSGTTCVVLEKLSGLTYLVEQRSGAFTLGEVLSNGTYTADQSSTYPKMTIYSCSNLRKVMTNQQDVMFSAWRAATAAEPTKYMVDYETGYLTLYPIPDQNYVIRLGVCRYPITAMTTTNMSSQTPAIDARYHNAIIDGICSLALLKRGEQTFDDNQAAIHMAKFEKAVSQAKIRRILFEDSLLTVGAHGGFS
jgi:hypothetical protein